MGNQGHTHLFVFSADGGAGDGGQGDGGSGDDGGQGQQGGDGGGSGFQPITSQEQFDRMVNERLTRERAKLADPSRPVVSKRHYDELKAKAAKLDEIEEKSKSDLDKERDRADKAEARAKEIEADAREVRLRSALLAEAAKVDRNVVDPEAAISLLDRTTLTLDDEGLPTNVAKAMDSLLEAKPYLVAANGGGRGSADQGARGGGGVKQLSRADLQSMSPDDIVKARREGRTAAIEGRT